MVWRQCGMVFAANGKAEWSRTHTQAPTAIHVDDRIRVYYGTRDASNRSRPSFIEFDAKDPTRLLYTHDRPVIDLGKPGTHDEDGVIASHIVRTENEWLMYYGGVSRGGSVPYRMSIGLARSLDNGLTFARVFEGPVVDRTPHEPYMTMAPNLLKTELGWTMWYGSGTRWVEVDGKFEPIYVIKMAHSEDGLNWERTNHTCIEPLHPLEANTRPSVVKSSEGYEMWFSYRSSVNYRDGNGSYRIGYATSQNGCKWHRAEDPETLRPTGTGWNASTVSYPNVIVVNGQKIMFYNGDGFGKSGIGCALWAS